MSDDVHQSFTNPQPDKVRGGQDRQDRQEERQTNKPINIRMERTEEERTKYPDRINLDRKGLHGKSLRILWM